MANTNSIFGAVFASCGEYTTVYLFNLHHNLAYYWPVNSTIKIFLGFQRYVTFPGRVF